MKKLVLTIIVLVGLLLTGCFAREETRIPLVKLQNKDGFSGSFFLGTGSIKSQEYYYFMYRMSDGGIRRRSVRVEQAMIYETMEQPYVSALLSYKRRHGNWENAGVYASRERIKFYIPPGSIISNYKVD